MNLGTPQALGMVPAAPQPRSEAPAGRTEPLKLPRAQQPLASILFGCPPTPSQILTPWQIVFYRVGNRRARRGLADPK